jgi:hypothetical protein
MKLPAPFCFETHFRRSASHIREMVDSRGATFFHVFMTKPVEAVFDWPDFVDVPARYWEVTAMLELMDQCDVKAESNRLRQWLFSHFRDDGQVYRPDSAFSKFGADLFDQSRILYSLVTWAMHHPEDQEVKGKLRALCEALRKRATFENEYAYIGEIGLYNGGTLIRPMLHAGLVLGEESYIDFARRLAIGILEYSDHFKPDGSFKGHMHSALGVLAGIAAVSILDKNKVRLERVRQIFDYACSLSTEHGFVPEVAQREDDLSGCETCAIMDYLDTALLLARYLDGRYWELIEKVTRNHLAKSQVPDADWLDFSVEGEDEEGLWRKNFKKRLAGAFAGWSAPHALLAYGDPLWPAWVSSEEMYQRYLGKFRVLQNCCACAGTRAFHQVWCNAVTGTQDEASINLLMNRETDQVKITSFIPLEGRVQIEAKKRTKVRFRIPDRSSHLRARLQGKERALRLSGGYADAGILQEGDSLEILFDFISQTKAFQIGNPGFQKYDFEADWYGETVLDIRPSPQNAAKGFSHVIKEQVPLYYHNKAPGLMYAGATAEKNEPIPFVSIKRGTIDWYNFGELSLNCQT